MDRYNKHIILSEIGQSGQDKLAAAKVLVVGAGGLGCPILQYLAAAGVGAIGIIDFDVVEMTNLQRQVLFGTSSIGQNKAEAAKQKLQDLNDSIIIMAYPEKLTYQNAVGLCSQYDIIVDGTDNFETRYLINDTCIITNKPLVYGAIYKFQGQVSVFNYNFGPTYRCIFPNKPNKDVVPNCSEIGVLGILPGIIGTIQANEILKIILGIGKVLSGQLFCYDALTNQTTIIKIKKSEAEIQKVLLHKNGFHLQQFEDYCTSENIEVSIQDLLTKDNLQFIDVRELHEKPNVEGISALKVPMSQLEKHIKMISIDKVKAFFCQSGIRSKIAVSILKQHNIHHCYSIKEGALEINRYIKELHKQATNE